MATAFLIHGGLWEDMDAERFWRAPGIVAGLEQHGVHVLAPERARRATSWAAEAEHLAAALPGHPVVIVAGSYGCSAAVRLALAAPDRVERLLLAWPATAGEPALDDAIRAELAGLGAAPSVADALVAGETLPGVADDELAAVEQPVGLLPSVPHNVVHQRRTVDALLAALPRAVELPGSPEPPSPAFPPHAASFVRVVVGFVDQT